MFEPGSVNMLKRLNSVLQDVRTLIPATSRIALLLIFKAVNNMISIIIIKSLVSWFSYLPYTKLKETGKRRNVAKVIKVNVPTESIIDIIT